MVEGGDGKKKRRQRENLSLPPMCGDVCITIFYVWFVSVADYKPAASSAVRSRTHRTTLMSLIGWAVANAVLTVNIRYALPGVSEPTAGVAFE